MGDYLEICLMNAVAMTRCIWSKNRWEVENGGAEHQAVWKGIPTTYSCPSVGRRIFPWVGPYQVLLYINMSVGSYGGYH